MSTKSSIRYKDTVRDMGDKSSEIFNLRPITFHYKSDESKKNRFGLIAELVVYDDEKLPESVKYLDLIPLMLNETQRLAKRVRDLEKGNL